MNEAGDQFDVQHDGGYSIQELAVILSLTVMITTVVYFAIIHHPSVIAKNAANLLRRVSIFSTKPLASIYIYWQLMLSAIVKNFMAWVQCPEDVLFECSLHCASDIYCFQTCGVLYGQCDPRV